MIKLSEDEIMEVLSDRGIVKRPASESLAEEDFEPWDEEKKEEL